MFKGEEMKENKIFKVNIKTDYLIEAENEIQAINKAEQRLIHSFERELNFFDILTFDIKEIPSCINCNEINSLTELDIKNGNEWLCDNCINVVC